jgi:hypothetical protein
VGLIFFKNSNCQAAKARSTEFKQSSLIIHHLDMLKLMGQNPTHSRFEGKLAAGTHFGNRRDAKPADTQPVFAQLNGCFRCNAAPVPACFVRE